MKTELKKLNQQRTRFRATFGRYGEKAGWKGYVETTLLFKDVARIDTGEVVANHLWFTEGGWSPTKLEEGDIVEFDARVRWYYKGYQGRLAEERGEASCEKDYKLSHPSKCFVVKQIEMAVEWCI